MSVSVYSCLVDLEHRTRTHIHIPCFGIGRGNGGLYVLELELNIHSVKYLISLDNISTRVVL